LGANQNRSPIARRTGNENQYSEESETVDWKRDSEPRRTTLIIVILR
jgi:hypothetical protein